MKSIHHHIPMTHITHIARISRISPLLPALCATTLVLALLGLPSTTSAKGDKAVAGNKAATSIEPNAKRFEELVLSDFGPNPENIDHPFWPLKPGNQWVIDGTSLEDGKLTKHRIIFTVTDLVKMIGGVRARVIFDTDISNGKMTEQELTFFAQDKVGNVWHLGQYRETFETAFVGGQIWTIDNPAGAKAGIYMPANPMTGTPSFSQGFAPYPFNWSDRGRVYKTGQKMKVPFGSYDDVLVVEEFDAEHSGTLQLKYYARGIGNIAVGARGEKGGSVEDLKLTKFQQLGEKELAEVRAKALELEKRGSMYPLPPMEHVPKGK